MERRYSALDVFRGASVASVGLLTLVLLALLPAPGYRTSRLLLFGLVALVAWVGAAGAVWKRVWPLVGGAAGLFLLGFWQFTLGVVMLPAAAVLLTTALLVSGPSSGEASGGTRPA